MSRPRERGVALVAAVGALGVLTILALGLAATTVEDQRATARALAGLQAAALARSGVAVATVMLGETGVDPTRANDLGRQPLGPGWVRVTVEDEARRLDLNAPELADALPRLLALLGLDPGLADAIADWTDPDDVPRARGAERAWYASATPPVAPRNGPFAAPAELALVRGVDASTLARLRPFVTVAGEHAVDVNTAPREVLLAVIGDPPAVDRVLTARARRALVDDDLGTLIPDAPPAVRRALVVHGERWAVRAVAGVGPVRRSVEATIWAPDGAEPTLVAWRPAAGAPGVSR